MSGAIRPLHQYVFMAWCSVKAQDRGVFPNAMVKKVIQMHLPGFQPRSSRHMSYNVS
jgi:hypothetical protein